MKVQPGGLRIIGGELRGRRLHAPPGERTRPTASRAREGLFGWVGDHVEEADVLDVFSGTGALGFEALSRGASHVLFVERDEAAAAALRRNLRDLQLGGRARLLVRAAAPALRRLTREGRRFDLVLADPPYGEDLRDLLGEVQLASLLRDRGLLIVERRTRGQHAARAARGLDALELVGSRSYGQTVFDAYRPASEPGLRTDATDATEEEEPG